MLTLKLVEPNGHEQMYEAEKVWTEPVEHGNHLVYFRWKSLQEGLVTSCFGSHGQVYVMNSEGKTIARYTLPTK